MSLLTQLLRQKPIIAFAIPLLIASIAKVTPALNNTEPRSRANIAAEKAVERKLFANTLTPQEVNLRAKQITVRIDGAGTGTGVIVSESKSSYLVLTNWHVVKNSGDYSVRTIDGRKHVVDYQTVRQLPNLDLAILQFERKQNYQLAELGNSNRLIEGQSLYFAGYPGELRKEDNRYYRFFSASLVGLLPESTANGYSLIYNGEAFPGMSGGPVLNSEGLLIGIHGETNIHAITGGTSNYGIPIDRYQNAIANITKPAAESNPQNTANSSNTDNNNSAVAPSVTVNTSPPEAKTPNETTTTQNNSPVTPESSPTESTAKTPNEANPVPNTTQPLNSQTPPETNNSNNSSEISSVPTLTTTNSKKPVQPSRSANKPQLLSSITGIDYTPLKKLLVAKKWEEANRQTQFAIARIIETAKRQNNGSSITINEIADYACQDMYVIDSIWQQYSNKKFGFSPQQSIWQNIKQDNNFSLNTWRSFATEIGWKKGEITDGSGYLLYEQLTFNPQTAPQGHLPWWFAASEEQQQTIKKVFNRCSFTEIERPKPTREIDRSQEKSIILLNK